MTDLPSGPAPDRQMLSYDCHAGVPGLSSSPATLHINLKDAPDMKQTQFNPPVIRRLALVTETWAPDVNGVANTLQQLHEILSQHMEVDVVRPRSRGAPDSGPGLRVRGFPLPGYPELQFGIVRYRKLIRHWQKKRPDVVYAATQGPLGVSAIRAARALDIPVASGFHTNFHAYSRYYRAGFMEPLIRLYLRWFHNRTQTTLTPTPEVKAEVEALGIRHVQVWGRAVNAERFNPAHRSDRLRRQWGLSPGDLAVIHVGRLAAEKNLEQVVATYMRIRAQVHNSRLILVGDGPLRKRLQQRHPEFVFCGTQRGQALARHYASGDLFLFPSETETFGNVVLEAMASGLAIVAYDRAAARIHIDSGRNGMKVPEGDEQAFSAAALLLATCPTRLHLMRRAAREHAREHDWERLAVAFLERITCSTYQRARQDETASSHPA